MNSTTRSASPARPWYREPWPWILMGLPGTVVVAGFITFYLAAHNTDGLVVDDYYKEGLAINRTLRRQEAARKLGLSGALAVEGGGVSLVLKANDAYVLPNQLRLRVAHPTIAGQDQVVSLVRAEGVFRGVMHPLEAGHWQFLVEDEAQTWRIAVSAKMPAAAPLTLVPGA
ncbi:FixH family protein [Niveibacterium sp. COAC-50]|uniref:FixH family protein n=1 Tax=Niveibacterium sp. COAC-50 TaxID=2729384 RepID=UPI00211073AD|nr:FixH family protein [Niveibacterium sp. COAC-50]